MSFWLVGWAVGEFIVGAMILSGLIDLIEGDAEYLREPWGGFAGVFMLAWFGGWTVGGVSAVRKWMWMAFGREIITVSSKEIEISEITIGDGKSCTYDASHIRNLRVVRERENDPLAFDYGADTIRFGTSMSEGEADLILERIQDKVQNRVGGEMR